MKSVEQQLHEAYIAGRGVSLSASKVEDLVHLDDAVRVRITNTACHEAGVEEAGADCMRMGESWKQFKQRLRDLET